MKRGQESRDGLVAALESVLSEYPVTLALLFGSRATGETREDSDTDVAVVFEDDTRSFQSRGDAMLALGADLAEALGTDDVDVLDLETASASLGQQVLEEGVLLVGTETERRNRLERLSGECEREAAADRFDAVLSAIDDHLA
jgi:predicted nucleotidyltransferase